MEDVNYLSPSKKFDVENAKQKRRKELEEDPSVNNEKINKRLSSEFKPIYWGTLYKNYIVNSYFDYIMEYLKSLDEKIIFELLNILLAYREFERMEKDFYDYDDEPVKDWRGGLIHYIRKSPGIIYDPDKKELKIDDRLNVQEQIQLPDLINIETFKEDVFYKDLSHEINNCYKRGCHTAVFVLLRKLLENLLIDVLRKKYPENEGDNIDIYYGRNTNRFHDFSILLKKLERRKSEFGADGEAVEEFLKRIKPFKLEANSKAHSIIIQGRKEDIDKPEIERTLGLLLRLNKSPP